MIFKNVGMLWKKNMKNKVWWMKLAVALILSNIFFFYLFGGKKETAIAQDEPGMVEVTLPAKLLTPFAYGKRILLLNKQHRLKLEGKLKSTEPELIVVWVPEKSAEVLFKYEGWEILPYLKNFTFRTLAQGESHEIRY